MKHLICVLQAHSGQELHSAAERGAWCCISALLSRLPVDWLAPSECRGRVPASGTGAVPHIAGAWHHSARWGVSSFAPLMYGNGTEFAAGGCMQWVVSWDFWKSKANVLITSLWDIPLIWDLLFCALLLSCTPITSGKETWFLWQRTALPVLHQFPPPPPPICAFKWKRTRGRRGSGSVDTRGHPSWKSICSAQKPTSGGQQYFPVW